MQTQAEYEQERGYDIDTELLVGTLLQLYVNRNLTNNEIVDREQNIEVKGFENDVYKCVVDLKPLLDDIAETSLRGSKLFLLSRFWEDNYNKRMKGKIHPEGTENPAMIELQNIIPHIIGFTFDKWYMMKNENYGRPYSLSPVFLDLADGVPSSLCEIYKIGKTFLTLKDFRNNIVSEYEGDFSEIID